MTSDYHPDEDMLGLWVEQKLIVRSRVLRCVRAGDNHGHPRYKDILVGSTDMVIKEGKRRVSDEA